tara:strand:+ start:109 stop:594 length:486 start_codon:yes stop_codon:yes gene_type:complete
MGVFILNYLNLQSKLDDVFKGDIRNNGVTIYAHYDNFINPNIIIFNFWDIEEDKAMADIDRVLLQFSEQIKNGDYQKLIFSFRFNKKFYINGDYLTKLGKEYSTQNPVYTLRTLAENIYKLNGQKAFSTWTGGLLGVIKEQMDDHNTFHQEWYLEDWAKSH